MIQSILDNDLYKFTMQQAVHMLYPRAEAEYVFIDRGNTRFPDGFADRLKKEVSKMADFRLSKDERRYLKEVCYFLTPVYLEFLASYIYNPEEVIINQDKEKLSVTVKGPWYRTILWEVPLMASISELYFEMTQAGTVDRDARISNNRKKGQVLSSNKVTFADFGTRRRVSSNIHKELIHDLLSVENNTLVGTSNVHLARKFNIKPLGTLAHEWFMFHAVLHGYQMANSSGVDAWVSVYHGDLGIALTDTYTTDIFLNTFDTMHAKLFDGVRQDSGNPFKFVDKILTHYKKLRIDPTTKTVVFSDGLDIDKAVAIHRHCQGKIRDSYGIGTNLTNDLGVAPLNIVIKMAKCRMTSDKPWRKTIKLSDDKGKHTGDKQELESCLRIFNLTNGNKTKEDA